MTSGVDPGNAFRSQMVQQSCDHRATHATREPIRMHIHIVQFCHHRASRRRNGTAHDAYADGDLSRAAHRIRQPDEAELRTLKKQRESGCQRRGTTIAIRLRRRAVMDVIAKKHSKQRLRRRNRTSRHRCKSKGDGRHVAGAVSAVSAARMRAGIDAGRCVARSTHT